MRASLERLSDGLLLRVAAIGRGHAGQETSEVPAVGKGHRRWSAGIKRVESPL
jgi:hypothetical protein